MRAELAESHAFESLSRARSFEARSVRLLRAVGMWAARVRASKRHVPRPPTFGYHAGARAALRKLDKLEHAMTTESDARASALQRQLAESGLEVPDTLEAIERVRADIERRAREASRGLAR